MLGSCRRVSANHAPECEKMAKTEYELRRFAAKTRRVIDQANAIMDEYGTALTLRQLHYQFVARDLYDNTNNNYKRLGDIVRNGRMGGLIDWDNVEDRTRSLYARRNWRSPESAIDTARYSYEEDLWDDQPIRPEVWIEKNALTGVIGPTTGENRIAYFPTIGYPSTTSLKEAARRIQNFNNPPSWHRNKNPQKVVIVFGVENFEVRRIGLTMDQINQYQPPPSFAKETSSRYRAYVDRYGTREAWELDALEPAVIQQLIQDAVDSLRDEEIWENREAEEAESERQMVEISDRYAEIIEFLEGDDDDEEY